MKSRTRTRQWFPRLLCSSVMLLFCGGCIGLRFRDPTVLAFTKASSSTSRTGFNNVIALDQVITGRGWHPEGDRFLFFVGERHYGAWPRYLCLFPSSGETKNPGKYDLHIWGVMTLLDRETEEHWRTIIHLFARNCSIDDVEKNTRRMLFRLKDVRLTNCKSGRIWGTVSGRIGSKYEGVDSMEQMLKATRASLLDPSHSGCCVPVVSRTDGHGVTVKVVPVAEDRKEARGTNQ